MMEYEIFQGLMWLRLFNFFLSSGEMGFDVLPGIFDTGLSFHLLLSLAKMVALGITMRTMSMSCFGVVVALESSAMVV